MPVHAVERKLAAIFAADIAGYSRLMARDEVGTLGRLKACRAITPQIVPSVLPWRRPEDRELLLSGLRLAIGEAT